MSWLSDTWVSVRDGVVGYVDDKLESVGLDIIETPQEARAKAKAQNKGRVKAPTLDLLANAKLIENLTKVEKKNISLSDFGYYKTADNASKKKAFKDTAVGQFLGSVWDGVKNGARNGAQYLVDKTVGKWVGSDVAQDSTDALGDYGSQVATKAISKFFKRNWYFFLLPPMLGVLVWKFLSTQKKVKRRRR